MRRRQQAGFSTDSCEDWPALSSRTEVKLFEILFCINFVASLQGLVFELYIVRQQVALAEVMDLTIARKL